MRGDDRTFYGEEHTTRPPRPLGMSRPPTTGQRQGVDDDSYGNRYKLYRVIVTVRQQFADIFPHCITQVRQGKCSQYKALDY